MVILCLTILGLATATFGINYSTVTNGNWSDPTTWDANGIPPSGLNNPDSITLNHNVILVVNYSLGSALLTIENNRTLTIASGVTFTNSGVIIIIGNLDFSSGSAKFENFGTIKGNGLVTGDFVNLVEGIVDPGFLAPGDQTDKLTFCGNFTNFGKVKVDIAWTNDHDKINFNNSGNFIISGILEVVFIEGFFPSSNDAFDIVVGASGRTGEFTSVIWPVGYEGAIKYKSNGVVIEGVVLPIELKHFVAFETDQGVELQWSTSSEEDNRGFGVERSQDGILWEELDFLNGQGTSNVGNVYSYLDKNSLIGLVYYRLRQIDFSGTETFSSVRSVFINRGKGDVGIFPNPVRLSATLILPNDATSYWVRIFSVTGQIVFSDNMYCGSQALILDSVNNGLYKLLVIDEAGRSSTLTFEKL